jgi:FKBP-type peptidyl-prolyl cis-trans isomerase FklB
MEKMSNFKSQLAEDVNASYFLSRLEELIKTKNFLDVAKSLPDITLAKGQKFLAENSKKKGVITLESGLQYEVLEKGTGEKPDSNDSVKVHYEGTLIDGEVFDSSFGQDDPVSFQVSQGIKGWTEALQLMTVGDKWKLFIPSDLAYGETGNNSIGPNETLIFEVELIGVTPKEIPESPLDLNRTDVNSTSDEAPPIIPEVDANTSMPVVEENATAPTD